MLVVMSQTAPACSDSVCAVQYKLYFSFFFLFLQKCTISISIRPHSSKQTHIQLVCRSCLVSVKQSKDQIVKTTRSFLLSYTFSFTSIENVMKSGKKVKDNLQGLRETTVVLGECDLHQQFILERPHLKYVGCINVDQPVKGVTSLPRLDLFNPTSLTYC